MVGAAGIEPATICSQSRYATAALRPGGLNYPTRTARQRGGGAGVGVFGVGARLLGGGVGVGVFVEVGVGVPVVGEFVGVLVGVSVRVLVAVLVFVGVSVGGSGVFVGELVGLTGVAVNVFVEAGGGVPVVDGVREGVGVAGRGVGVGEGVSLGVGVGVGVPDGHSTTMNSTVLFCTSGPPWNWPRAASHVAVSVMVPPFLPWSLSCVKSKE